METYKEFLDTRRGNWPNVGANLATLIALEEEAEETEEELPLNRGPEDTVFGTHEFTPPVQTAYFALGYDASTGKVSLTLMPDDLRGRIVNPRYIEVPRKTSERAIERIEEGLTRYIDGLCRNVGLDLLDDPSDAPMLVPYSGDEKTLRFLLEGLVSYDGESLVSLVPKVRDTIDTDVLGTEYLAIVGDYDERKRTGYFADQFTEGAEVTGMVPYDTEEMANDAALAAEEFVMNALKQTDPKRIFTKVVKVEHDNQQKYAVAVGVRFSLPQYHSEIDRMVTDYIQSMDWMADMEEERLLEH
jgi:hypothetical protein